MASFPGDQYQRDNCETINRAGYDVGANAKARFAGIVLGWGENDMRADGCNASNHCGIFQIDTSWQSMHDYHDVYYWAKYAYEHGFWGRGGLKQLAIDYPHESAGYIVNLCQGAYTNLAAGAAYYDRYQDLAKRSIAAIPSGPSGGGGGGGSTPAISTVPMGKVLAAYNPSTIIRHDCFRLGEYGGSASDHALALRHMVERVKFCDDKGPGY